MEKYDTFSVWPKIARCVTMMMIVKVVMVNRLNGVVVMNFDIGGVVFVRWRYRLLPPGSCRRYSLNMFALKTRNYRLKTHTRGFLSYNMASQTRFICRHLLNFRWISLCQQDSNYRKKPRIISVMKRLDACSIRMCMGDKNFRIQTGRTRGQCGGSVVTANRWPEDARHKREKCAVHEIVQVLAEWRMSANERSQFTTAQCCSSLTRARAAKALGECFRQRPSPGWERATVDGGRVEFASHTGLLLDDSNFPKTIKLGPALEFQSRRWFRYGCQDFKRWIPTLPASISNVERMITDSKMLLAPSVERTKWRERAIHMYRGSAHNTHTLGESVHYWTATQSAPPDPYMCPCC